MPDVESPRWVLPSLLLATFASRVLFFPDQPLDMPAVLLGRGVLEYDAALFDADAVESLVARFRILLGALRDQPDVAIGTLPFLTEEERRTILVEWNAKEAEFPREVCLHQLFEAKGVRFYQIHPDPDLKAYREALLRTLEASR